MITKTQLLESIDNLPEEFEREDVIERLIIIDKYNKGISQINEGKTMPISQFKKEFEAWRLSR
ncbi:MAG: hypothetical protein ACK4YV_14835 [Emticicia sp.]